jgi:hypothetical protein
MKIRRDEDKIRNDFIKYLKVRDWICKITHGNAYQYGFPDVYCAHRIYGQRWVEIKLPSRATFTGDQINFFKKLTSVGVGIWIVTDSSDYEYSKLFNPPNWFYYLLKATIRKKEEREPKIISPNDPEAIIQRNVITKLQSNDWVVKSTYGNIYQYGFPDLYCAHKKFGQRWVEVKNPLSYRFTGAQLSFFPLLSSVRVGVWILTSDSDEEYDKLFRAPNWHQYLGKSCIG